MKIAVIGATGTIGSAVSDRLSSAGYQVIKVSRKSRPAVDLEKPETIAAFFAESSELDGVVVAAGNPAFGPLGQLSPEQILSSLGSKLSGQLLVVRHGLEKMKSGGVFVLTGGTLAHDPWPGTSMAAMVNAGLEGFVKAAALDLGEEKRIAIVHPPLVKETAPLFGMDDAPWPPAAKVAESYLEAVQSPQSGQAFYVPGFQPKG